MVYVISCDTAILPDTDSAQISIVEFHNADEAVDYAISNPRYVTTIVEG